VAVEVVISPTKFRVDSITLVRWVRENPDAWFEPRFVVIDNEWTRRIVWAQIENLTKQALIHCSGNYHFFGSDSNEAYKTGNYKTLLLLGVKGNDFVRAYDATYNKVEHPELSPFDQNIEESRDRPSLARYSPMFGVFPDFFSPEATKIYDQVPSLTKARWHLIETYFVLKAKWKKHEALYLAVVFGLPAAGVLAWVFARVLK
jgi:hypothetical protein